MKGVEKRGSEVGGKTGLKKWWRGVRLGMEGAVGSSQGREDQENTVGFTEGRRGARTGQERGHDGSVCGLGSR